MELQHLKYLVEIERAGSITKAAKELFMSQPNLSRAVKEVENETGFAIFRRTARGAQPTEMGMRFLDYARRILSQVDEMESLYRPRKESDLLFRLSAPGTAYLAEAFADFMGAFAEKRPMQVHYRETESLKAISDVESGRSQLGIIRFKNLYADYFLDAVKAAKLESQTIWEYKMCLILSEDHPLVPCGEIPYHLLDGFTEISHGEFSVPPLAFRKISYGARLPSGRRRIFADDRASIFRLLRQVKGAYMWESPQPLSVLRRYGLVQKECPLSDGLCSDRFICRKGHRHTEEEEAFMEQVKKYAVGP